MKHQLLLICLFITMQQVNAQTISRYVIPTNGSEYKDSNIHVSATVGETFTYTLNNNIITATQGFQQPDSLGLDTLHLTFFIQGYYINNHQMSPALFNSGICSDASITDTVEVSIINSTAPYAVRQTTKAVLHTDGKLDCTFHPMLLGNSYYISLRHRSIVETWSANPITLSKNTYYDFSTSAAQALGDNQIDVESEGIYSIFNGDVNLDLTIDAYDFLTMDVDLQNFNGGYLPSDLNGDGTVDSNDFLLLDANMQNFVGAVTLP